MRTADRLPARSLQQRTTATAAAKKEKEAILAEILSALRLPIINNCHKIVMKVDLKANCCIIT